MPTVSFCRLFSKNTQNEKFIYIVGPPRILQTDNGKEFNNEDLTEVVTEFKTRKNKWKAIPPPITSPRSEEVNNANGLNFNLETAYSALRTNALPTAAAGIEEQAHRNNRYVQTPRGYSAKSLPFVETVTPQVRRSIITGMDIILSSLLIPYYVGTGTTDGEEKNETSKLPH
ncbi:unnamed protein product [Mytilus coruscus]|uniref:Integrase catalytic domain-containing protein n=1 Tax=Mytilus coruscus TaxID=42192 RepID=A0A6J8DJF9_MYTCO|nr:unnamed protein product [Mytilus coruscus]